MTWHALLIVAISATKSSCGDQVTQTGQNLCSHVETRPCWGSGGPATLPQFRGGWCKVSCSAAQTRCQSLTPCQLESFHKEWQIMKVNLHASSCISAPCFWSFTNHHKFNLLLAWPFAKRACPPCCRSYNLLGNQDLGATDAFKAWIRLGMIFGTSKVSCKLAAKLMKTDFVPKKCLVFKGCGLEATAETEWTNMTYISQKNNCDPQRQELCSGRYAPTVLVLLGCCVCCRVYRVCTG